MKRPLLSVALFYGGGILAANFLPSFPPLPFLLAGALVALVCLFSSFVRPFLVWPLLVLTGIANLNLHTAVLSPGDLRAVVTADAEIVSLRGTLAETPYQRVYDREGEASWRTLATLDVQSLRQKGGPWRNAEGTLVVSTPGVLAPEFFGGRAVEVEGVLQRPTGPIVEGQFDYQTYLKRHGIYFQLRIGSTNDWRFAPDADPSGRPPIADRFGRWAKGILSRGLPDEDEPLRLLWAMTLGWKTALNGEIAEPFMRSGTMHVFAISGLHIALIAGILVALFRVFRLPRAVTGALVIPLIWFYTHATGWQPSAIRSTIMMTVILVGWSIRRPSDLLNSLAASALIILLWDPQQLFQASFQLSFCVVLSLALLVPFFDSLHRPLLEPVPDQSHPRLRRVIAWLGIPTWILPDPFLPETQRPRWHQWVARPLQWLVNGFVTSLAAWLGSIPLVAYYFNLLTPVSLLANMIVVPLSSGALACNMASLTVGGWFPACAELFNHAAWFFMLEMIRVSEWAAALPGGCVHVGAPSLLAFALYYAALLAVMTGWLWKPRTRLWVGAALAVLGVAAFWQWQVSRAAARLTLIPLNGGEAFYFAGPGAAEDLLIDCGNDSSAQMIVKPFLRSRGVSRLDRLLLTHGDVHHVGGADLVRRQFRVGKVFLSPVSFRSTSYREIQFQFEKTPGLTHTVHRGERIGPWLVLHPDDADHFRQADDNAVVLRGEVDGTRILLLSDLGKPGQGALLERGGDLRGDLVVSGVPVQSEPLADALLEAIQPRAIVITDSLYPASARASRKLRERLKERNVPLFFTSETGAITVFLRNRQWELRNARGVLFASRAPSATKDIPANSQEQR